MGISVGGDAVHAVLVRREAIAWAGRATYAGLDDLVEVIARLAGEGNGVARPGRVRIVLDRQAVQLRTIAPAPPLRASAARRWVALEGARLFRKNGSPLVTDARFVRLEPRVVALWAAAAPEPLLEAVLAGCAGAALEVATIGVAAEVLPRALVAPQGRVVLPNGSSAEALEVGARGTWRSRLIPITPEPAEPVRWVAPLAALGAEAAHFAPAYAAATVEPRLALLPAGARRTRAHEGRRRVVRLAMAAALLWLSAFAIYVLRLSATLHAATQFLAAVNPAVDSVLTARRDLSTANAALADLATAAATRSRQVALLGAVAAALPDSAYLVSWQVMPDRTVRLAGYAPQGARVLAALERVDELRQARFEALVSRELVPGVGERDRFTLIARLGAWP
jgi:hypothetical protein